MKPIFVALSVIAAFGAGFGSGFFAVKKKCEARADKEVASVKEAFQKHMDEMSKEGKLKDVPPTRRGASKKKKEEKKDESNIRSVPLPSDPVTENYKDYSAPYRSTASGKPKQPSKERSKKLEPYVISPDDYMTSEYEAKSLTYYADKVLADDSDTRIDNPTLVVGREALTSFGRYEDDSVYVRDDNLKIDYEILRSEKDYADIAKVEGSPKQALQNGDDSE